jgi:hypothetical protein
MWGVADFNPICRHKGGAFGNSRVVFIRLERKISDFWFDCHHNIKEFFLIETKMHRNKSVIACYYGPKYPRRIEAFSDYVIPYKVLF